LKTICQFELVWFLSWLGLVLDCWQNCHRSDTALLWHPTRCHTILIHPITNDGQFCDLIRGIFVGLLHCHVTLKVIICLEGSNMKQFNILLLTHFLITLIRCTVMHNYIIYFVIIIVPNMSRTSFPELVSSSSWYFLLIWIFALL
jgi:uncharacterized membrane protein YqjE